MALVKRGNRAYYYQGKRENGRVVTRYIGKADSKYAQMTLLLDNVARIRKEHDRQRRNEQHSIFAHAIASLAEIEQTLGQIEQASRLMLDSAYILAGYHQHKRQWRRRRTAIGDKI